MTRRERCSVTAAFALFAMLGAMLVPAADTAVLDQLMTLLAQRRHGVADFEETQYLAVLKKPARSSGVLSYDAPDHLEQRTLKPRPQSAILDRGVLTLETGGRQRTVRLQDYPQLASVGGLTFLQSLRCATLALWDERPGRLISFRELRGLTHCAQTFGR